MKTKTASFSMSANFGFNELSDEGIPIEGFAIHPGIFHEIIEVPESELGNAAKTLESALLMLDHSQSVRDIVGLVKQADVQYDENAKKNGAKYRAFVDDKEIALSIQKNKIREVSIGFKFDPICSECGESFYTCPHFFDEAHILATNIDVKELSLVPFGADEEATVSIAGFKAQFNDKMKITDFKRKEDKMTDKKDKSVDVTALFEKATEAEKLAFEEQEKAKKLADELAAAQKIIEEAELARKEAEEKLSKTEKELKDSKSELDKTSEKLTEKDQEDKKNFATEIAELKVEKGLIKEEELEKEVGELMEVEDLEPIKALVEKFEKKEEQHPTVPKLEEFKKALDEGKLDYKDQKVAQKFTHEIFGYDIVFKGKEPGQTYEGFTKHI